MPVPLYDALENAVKVLQEHADLPLPISVSMTEDGLWVTPWLRGAPMTALLAWREVMTDASQEFEVRPDGMINVTIRGLLGDVPVVAQAVTFQELSGSGGKLALAELRRAASEEEEF